MLSQFKNTKKQGDAGLGSAIAYFTHMGYTVCLPLTDSQDYDLVVDIDGRLSRVQVKTTRQVGPKGKYRVDLRTQGGNQSWSGVSKRFDSTKVEYLFVLLDNGETYCIPSSEMDNESRITPESGKFERFRCG